MSYDFFFYKFGLHILVGEISPGLLNFSKGTFHAIFSFYYHYFFLNSFNSWVPDGLPWNLLRGEVGAAHGRRLDPGVQRVASHLGQRFNRKYIFLRHYYLQIITYHEQEKKIYKLKKEILNAHEPAIKNNCCNSKRTFLELRRYNTYFNLKFCVLSLKLFAIMLNPALRSDSVNS